MISLAEASRRSGIPYITLKRRVAAGELPGATKEGREWRVPFPLPGAVTDALPRRRDRSDKVRELPHTRYIGVVDTGLVEQLEQSRESEKWLRRQLDEAQRERQRLLTLIERGLTPRE